MIKKISLVFFLLITITGCTTTGTFRVPPGADLYIYKRPQPVDIPGQHTNLHNELMTLLEGGEESHLPDDVSLYAVAYRPIRRDSVEQVDLWPERLAMGSPLPVMPCR